MSVLAEFDQIQNIKVAKEKENMQRVEIVIKSNNQEAVSCCKVWWGVSFGFGGGGIQMFNFD